MKDEKIIQTKKSPVQSIIITLVGVALLILGIIVVNNETLAILLVVAGVAIIICGIVMIALAMGKNSFDYIYEPTGKKLKKYKIYLNEQDSRTFISCINANDFKKINKFKKSMDTGHMLECMGTNDGEIFVFQLSEYVPHSYVPSSPVITIHGDEARAMLELVKS
jgi:membrane-bound ClpP family serine protease